MDPAGNLTAVTYRYERGRAVAAGILETAGQTFLLLIAVRYFAAGATAKALVASGFSIGLLLSLPAVALLSPRRWTPARAASWLAAAGAAIMLAMFAFPVLPVFVVGSLAALACTGMAIPFLTQLYQDNYPADRRGRLFSRTVMIRVLVAALFSELAGRALSADLGRSRWLLLGYAAAFAGSALWLARYPSRPLVPAGSSHPFRAFRFVREDRVFRWTLICWMLMGFANLMMLPLRVEYLANPAYGLTLSTSTVAVLVGVIPNLARLVMSPIWGRLFDRMNFFLLRVVLNLGFALGIVTFFTSHSLTGLILGAVVFGVSNAGGDVAWTLWVTKFAPPDRVADYMSVHTFSTGLRGVIAPLVAFHLVAHFSVAGLGGVSAAMIVLASAILAREIRLGKSPDPGPTLITGKDEG